MPYLSQVLLKDGQIKTDLAQVLEIDEADAIPYPFLIAERESFALRTPIAHSYAFITDNASFSKRFDPVFEVRAQNEAGDWQPWQTIVHEQVTSCSFSLRRETAA